MNNIDYSVVIPVFNSEAMLATLFARLDKVFKAMDKQYEVIFVEDRGSDNSWEVIKSLYNAYPQVVCGLRLSRNFGQHAATLCGMQCATGKFIITIDDDLQLPPEEIPKLIARQAETNADCVYGIYNESHQTYIRKIGSRLMQYAMKATFNCKVDVSSFRLLRRELVQKITRHKQGFLFLEGLIGWHTQDIAAATITRQKRQYGRSGYNLLSLARLLLHLVFNYTVFPLYFAVCLGVLTILIALLFLGNIIHFYDFGLPISSAIIGSIWLMGGLIALCLSAIMAYLARIYATQQQMPPFSIKETLPEHD
jgi:glycosyltransferase involved in cell wall biosynthesis